MMLILGECLEKMKELADSSIDSIVTDPPYGLSFMGKKWDYDVPSTEIWKECLRVLKPGGHVLSFGGTRTYHRMVVNMEDAGFEIRDQVMWIYGSGFPKSTDISKRIDKEAGAERIVTKEGQTKAAEFSGKFDQASSNLRERRDFAATDAAKQWQGWGTALKPANEPICLARKPLERGLTVADNVLKWGTGAINVDASRIATEEKIPTTSNQNIKGAAFKADNSEKIRETFYVQSPQGRWPANILFDEAAAEMLGEPSRFFYVAKASKAERGEGNAHPTVKPIKLMEYLCKLITPRGGVVLDPFMGSGSTGVAAKNLGFKFIGIEMNEEYFEIAKRRING